MNMHIVLNLAQMPKLWQVLHAPNTKQGNQIALKVEHTNETSISNIQQENI